ncbi:MAG: methyl-accepting chemotaxis protein [Pseudomonadota bacterium]
MLCDNFNLSSKLVFLVSAFIVIFALFTLISYSTLNHLRVNGPVYEQIVVGKDLIADILPPPEYIMETYLVTLQMLGEMNEANVKSLIEKGNVLKNDYLTRNKYWRNALPEGRIKDVLIQQSYTPAMAFFDLRDNQFIPAFQKGDKAKATELAFSAMLEQYEIHRKAIDEVVKLSTEQNTNIEAMAAATIKTKTIVMILIAFIGILGLCMLALFITRSITLPIKRIIDGLQQGADQVASAAGQVSSASQTLAEGSSEQAATGEETSSSLEEMSSMTKQNASNAGQADSLMKQANQVVNNANTSMGQLTTSMQEISKASEETSKIIKTIDEIAFQTNLLALNAAVEAARAGEAGAGFAVVADEVRNLATRAADAAKNTAALIEGTLKKVSDGTALVKSTNDAFNEVAGSTRKVGELVGEIAAASSEQAQGIEQLNLAVTEMDKVAQQNAAIAEESASASEELNAQAEEMKGFVSRLAILVSGNTLVSQIRSGRISPPKSNGRSTPPQKRRIPLGHTSSGGKDLALRQSKALRLDDIIPMDEDDFRDF